ncbi:cuticle protein 7-like [Pararge aegeria]|uniref:Jg10650 protein n=1 Tax=Pararge aegeria aegeria TaxID=348720 RepID=A0A8S4RW90_9NEOP|nr:cuticle protein 7-like [Pararge aegeria]CAH2241481.1 jg10650 [Pararge aegeria aegeria]
MAFVLKTFVVLALTSPAFTVHAPGGYSYNRFSGPVSGKIIEVQVPAAEGAQQHADYGYNHRQRQIDPETAKYDRLKTVDYKAKPDYHYAYGVQDPHSGNQQDHKESREGDVVRGEYSLVEPDGSIRLVQYTADDKNGFQATVHKKPGGKPNAPVRYTQVTQPQQEDSGEY